MSKFKMYLIGIVSMCLFVGCGNNKVEQNDSEIQDNRIFAENSGSFELIRQKEDISENDITDNSIYYSSWTEEEIIKAVNERSQYYKASAYYSEIIDYWENIREVRDISNVLELLFETDKKYYTKEEFESEPMLVIYLAKNEIYARYGYIFKNKDLYKHLEKTKCFSFVLLQRQRRKNSMKLR